MALCLAISLIVRRGFVPYDQLVRYKWWYESGYMSSTGCCFDIGAATSQSLHEFIRRQTIFAKKHHIPIEKLDYLSDHNHLRMFQVHCSTSGVAGNGALMRLAPVPLFFHNYPKDAIEFSGYSGQITHGDTKAYDACRYYGALICATLHGYTKEQLLDEDFYNKHKEWFGDKPLCKEIKKISEGSYKKEGGYKDGIRGKGYIVNALEAALWAFWSDNNSFEKGVLAAVNLGDDTDTTAAIYGQLAGAYYRYKALPTKWVKHVYAKEFILNLSKWIVQEGKDWKQTNVILPSHSFSVDKPASNEIETPCARRTPRSNSTLPSQENERYLNDSASNRNLPDCDNTTEPELLNQPPMLDSDASTTCTQSNQDAANVVMTSKDTLHL